MLKMLEENPALDMVSCSWMVTIRREQLVFIIPREPCDTSVDAEVTPSLIKTLEFKSICHFSSISTQYYPSIGFPLEQKNALEGEWLESSGELWWPLFSECSISEFHSWISEFTPEGPTHLSTGSTSSNFVCVILYTQCDLWWGKPKNPERGYLRAQITVNYIGEKKYEIS